MMIPAILTILSLAAGPGVSFDGPATGSAVISDLEAGRFKAVFDRFDDAMKAALPEDRLRGAWEQITTAAGSLSAGGPPRTETRGAMTVVTIPLKGERLELNAEIAFDAAGRLAGLHFRPATSVAPPAGHAPYVKLDAFDARDVTVGAAGWRLPGTLLLPRGSGPVPAVVLVAGSGPQDRDETVGARAPFRDIAEGLASRGVAVLRYEKRTKAFPDKMAPKTDLTVDDEVTDDAVATVDFLRHTPGVDARRIFVLGHSLGAMLAPRIAARVSGLAGVILLAGATRPIEDLLLEQTVYILRHQHASPEVEAAEVERIRKEVARIKDPDLGRPSHDGPVLGAPASYWLSLRGVDPAADSAKLSIPILVMQGGRDYQVSGLDLDGWRKALAGRPGVTFKLYPSLDHLFGNGEGDSVPSDYDRPEFVDAPVVSDIAGWILNGARE